MHTTIFPLRAIFEEHEDACRLLTACRMHPSFIPRFCVQMLQESMKNGCSIETEIDLEYVYSCIDWMVEENTFDPSTLNEREMQTIAAYIHAVLLQMQRFVNMSMIEKPNHFISGFGLQGFIGHDGILFIEYSPYGYTWSDTRNTQRA